MRVTGNNRKYASIQKIIDSFVQKQANKRISDDSAVFTAQTKTLRYFIFHMDLFKFLKLTEQFLYFFYKEL